MSLETGSTKNLKLLIYAALILSMIANIVAISTFLHVQNIYSILSSSQPQLSKVYTASGELITPALSLPDAPIIKEDQPFGKRLTNINAPFTNEELSIINNAPDSYFDIAAKMYLNGSLANPISGDAVPSSILLVNGKPSVIYLGAISCIFCGENRWAMALALSRFGNFTHLFKGYSAFGDGNVPTIYWSPVHYNSSSEVEFGNFFRSDNINFLSIEYSSPITAGFQMQSLSFILQKARQIGNEPYTTAINLIIQANNFQGTPYTIWGKFAVPHADALIFGNSTVTSGPLPLTNMTHEQILRQLSKPSNQFAWSEYAAADIYVALLCASINNASPICNLNSIQQIEKVNGYLTP